jgi:hypothetical protein
VAAAPTTAAVSPSQDSLTVPQTLPTGPEHRFPPRCKSAPVQRSLTPDSTPASESPGTSSISRGSDRAPSPPANNPTQSQQQHHQQQQGSASPWDSAQPSGPLLVSTRMVGRQHQSSPWPPGPGCQLLLQRNPANPVDSCAILVSAFPASSFPKWHWAVALTCVCLVVGALEGTSVQSDVLAPPQQDWVHGQGLKTAVGAALSRLDIHCSLTDDVRVSCAAVLRRCAVLMAMASSAHMATYQQLCHATWLP